MPKSRHGRGKHPHYGKKSRMMSRPGAAATAPQAVAGTAEPAQPVAPAAALPARKTGTAPMPKIASMAAAKTAPNPYPYFTSELKRIAVLAGIIIVVLVVLSIVLM